MGLQSTGCYDRERSFHKDKQTPVLKWHFASTLYSLTKSLGPEPKERRPGRTLSWPGSGREGEAFGNSRWWNKEDALGIGRLPSWLSIWVLRTSDGRTESHVDRERVFLFPFFLFIKPVRIQSVVSELKMLWEGQLTVSTRKIWIKIHKFFSVKQASHQATTSKLGSSPLNEDGTREVAYWLKCWPCIHEDPSVVSRSLVTKQGVESARNPRDWERRDPEVCGPASLDRLVSSNPLS